MEEATVKLTRNGKGCYSVFSDCWTGKMEYVGVVEKSDRPMFDSDRWWARRNGKSVGHAATRGDAVTFLLKV